MQNQQRLYPELTPLLNQPSIPVNRYQHIAPARPVLFTYTDNSEPSTTHTIVDVKHVPSGQTWEARNGSITINGGEMAWITQEGTVIPGDHKNQAYQYYKMDCEFMECYNGIQTHSGLFDPANRDKALAYIGYKWLSRIESHLDTIRAIQIFWTVISVILIIAGIILGVRAHVFN